MTQPPDLGMPEFSPIGLSHGEVAALLDMFQHKGWEVFMKMRRADKQTSLEIVMNVSASPEDVAQHRVAYNVIDDDLCLESRLRTALQQKAAADQSQS